MPQEPPKHRAVGRSRESKPLGYVGTEAGKDEKYRQMQIKKYKDQFLKEKGWAGIAGAAKRPKDWQKQFRAWYKKKAAAMAKNKAQKKAVTTP